MIRFGSRYGPIMFRRGIKAEGRRAKDDAPPRGGFLATTEHREMSDGHGYHKAHPPTPATRPRARRLWRSQHYHPLGIL